METLELRVARLERSVRRHRTVGEVAAVLATVGVLAGVVSQSAGPPHDDARKIDVLRAGVIEADYVLVRSVLALADYIPGSGQTYLEPGAVHVVGREYGEKEGPGGLPVVDLRALHSAMLVPTGLVVTQDYDPDGFALDKREGVKLESYFTPWEWAFTIAGAGRDVPEVVSVDRSSAATDGFIAGEWEHNPPSWSTQSSQSLLFDPPKALLEKLVYINRSVREAWLREYHDGPEKGQ